MKYNKNEVTGKMRDRIILQNVNRSRSLTGFASESWADTATIWAFAESKLPGSNETIIDGKNTAKNVCDFTIRYISTITEESRVVWGDKLYQVKNLKVSHDRRFISFQGIFYDSYILTGVNVAASVTGIATTSANLKLIMSVIGQANAIASAIGEIVTAQQGLVEVASSVVANGTSTANVTKVIPINSSVAASANVSGAATIVQFVESSVQAAATSTSDVQLIKVIASSVTANATATSAIDVISQGLVTVEASVTATGTATADILRIATLQSSASTTADTSAIASLTKVLEASATATAQTSSDAQLTLAVNAAATTTAVTSADAQLSYTVNAAADATAQTSADAFITRIISADATATANSSVEAGIGVTFVAAAVASASVTSASVLRTATIAASVSGAASVSSTLTVTQLLLDLYPSAAAAYSLRRLRNAYTGSAIRVRRSSDNTEQNIGFTGNDLNTSALTTFVGAGNGFITTWYDQSGNGKDITQSTASNQPQIVSSGSVISQNTKPAVQFTKSNNQNLINATVATSSAMSYSWLGAMTLPISSWSYAFEIGVFDSTTGYLLTPYAYATVFDYNAGDLINFGDGYNTGSAPRFISNGIQTFNNTQTLYTGVLSSTNANGYKNNIAITSRVAITGSVPSTTGLKIGSNTFNEAFPGTMQEIVFWGSDQNTNVNGINTNINTHYGIY